MIVDVVKKRGIGFIFVYLVVVCGSLLLFDYSCGGNQNKKLSQDEFIAQLECVERKSNDDIEFEFDSAIINENGNIKYKYINGDKNIINDNKVEKIKVPGQQTKITYKSTNVLETKENFIFGGYDVPLKITKMFESVPMLGITEQETNNQIIKFKENKEKEIYEEYIEKFEDGVLFNKTLFSEHKLLSLGIIVSIFVIPFAFMLCIVKLITYIKKEKTKE